MGTDLSGIQDFCIGTIQGGPSDQGMKLSSSSGSDVLMFGSVSKKYVRNSAGFRLFSLAVSTIVSTAFAEIVDAALFSLLIQY